MSNRAPTRLGPAATRLGLLLLCALPVRLGAQTSATARLEVRRDGTSAVVLTAADIAALPHVEASATEHGKTGRFRGVPLTDVLRRAGVPVDSVRGPRAALYVLASAVDGYSALFSLAELTPGLGGRSVLLVDARDGKPLDAAEGPLRLVVPEDGRPTRWARQVTTLSVRAGAPVPQAAPPASLAGDWRGTSICTPAGKPACHDEVVVYHLRHDSTGGAGVERLQWVMNKVVAGREEDMGILDCEYRPIDAAARCPMRGWTWDFAVRGDTLAGTLANPGGVVWRDVRVVRVGTGAGGGAR